jgi:protein phosphatase
MLSTYDRQQVEQTISASSLEEAREIVSRLRTTTSKDGE